MSITRSIAPYGAAATCILLTACLGGSGEPIVDGTDTTPDPSSSNQPPEISGVPPAVTVVGATWRFQPFASDPDGDALQYFVDNAPSWTDFDPATGQLAGKPGEGDVGMHSEIVVSVTDGVATVSMPAFSVEVLPEGSSMGSVTLSWTPPTERVDGSPLGNSLAGYRILYGQNPNQYDFEEEILNPSITRHVVDDLAPGTWYFAVTAMTREGLESTPSASVNRRLDKPGARPEPGRGQPLQPPGRSRVEGRRGGQPG
jgi:hypothetical protein